MRFNGAKAVIGLLIPLLCHFSATVFGWNDESLETPSSNILLITMGGTKSHRVPFVALGEGLIAKGHKVTLLSGFRENTTVQGLEEVVPEKFYDEVLKTQDYDYLGTRIRNEFLQNVKDVYDISMKYCSSMLTDPATQSLLKRKYHLVIIDSYYPECAIGMAPVLKAPFMYLNTMTNYKTNIAYGGSPIPWAASPAFMLPFTDDMNFGERFGNVFMHLLMMGLQTVVSNSVLGLQKKYLDKNALHPLKLSKKVSFILQNSHPMVSYQSAYLPNVAEIGGIHCRPPNPLPKELNDYLDAAGESGFIFVSMGTSVNPTTMPPKMLRTIVESLGRLPYRVLWKFQKDLGDVELPPNVRIETWLPQQDLLGHKNIKAFVTHSGMFSTQETVYHGVPVVTLPVFADQETNAVKVAAEGYGIRLEIAELTVEGFTAAITEVVTNPKYKTAAKNAQKIFLDQQQTPLERAVFWTEYVIRNEGATHFYTAGHNMNWIQYYSYDVFLFVLGVMAVLLWFLKLSKEYSIRIIMGQKDEGTKKLL